VPFLGAFDVVTKMHCTNRHLLYFTLRNVMRLEVVRDFASLYILLWMHVCFSCDRFSFSVVSQEISWKEYLRNDPFVLD